MENILFYFVIYAFAGWCLEVVYAAVNTGTFVNRGFLNGPICPIYGIGAVLVIDFLMLFRDNLILLFFTSVIITSFLEYVTGFVLEKLFNNRWWDYSRYPFNIKGYICLKFSLAWGIGCILIIKVIHPVVVGFIGFISVPLGNIILLCLAVIFIIDIISTVDTVMKFNLRLRKIHEISGKIKEKSNFLGERISNETIELKSKYEYQVADIRRRYVELSENAVEIKEKYENELSELKRKYENRLSEIREIYGKELIELKETYKRLTGRKNNYHRRIIKAFPGIKSNKYSEALNELKKNVARK
ncbi:putative ABC transporter permease [Clostridium sp. LBM24168]